MDSKEKQCPKDKHNFVRTVFYTGGTIYRCDKCGLEINAPTLSGRVFKDYLGSYFNGVSHKWDPIYMRAEDIVSFDLSFGDLPIVTVKYDGAEMKIKNAINSSRDGRVSFPEGYFDEKAISLTHEEKESLNRCLLSSDFDSFTTPSYAFENFGAPGFCINKRFSCLFTNGKGFECLFPRCDDFASLTAVIKKIIYKDNSPIHSKKPQTTPSTDESFWDWQETGWVCQNCFSGNKIDYQYCGHCGTKRPF